MAVVRVPNTLRPFTGGRAEVQVSQGDLGAVLDELAAAFPDFAERIVDEDGRLYGFVNVFVGDAECRSLAGLATPVDAGAVISVVPAVAGG